MDDEVDLDLGLDINDNDLLDENYIDVSLIDGEEGLFMDAISNANCDEDEDGDGDGDGDRDDDKDKDEDEDEDEDEDDKYIEKAITVFHPPCDQKRMTFQPNDSC